MRFWLNFSNKIRVVKYRQFCIKLHAVTCILMSNAFKAPHEIKMPERSPEFPICNNMES